MDRRATDSLFHVAGIVVYAKPGVVARVATGIAALEGARVHAASTEGKLVVTLEAADAATVIATIDDVRAMPGVVGAVLVYQHSEDDVAEVEPDCEGSADEHLAGDREVRRVFQ